VIPGSPLCRQSAAAGAAQDFKAAGGRALVQWTPPGMGRHAEWLPGIAGQAGIHIIAATGLHQARHYSTAAGPPRWPATLGAAELAALFTEELTAGMRGDNGRPDPAGPPCAGVIKVAAGYHDTDEHERRALAAAGAAHQATGAPVCVHLELGTHGPAALAALAAAGVPPGHVILGHLARNPDFRLHAELAASGAYLAYDGPRRDTHPTDWRLGDLICAMLKAGYGDRILLGADTPTADRLDANGSPGPAALLSDTAAALARRVGEDAMHAILVVNPGRAFTWREWATSRTRPAAPRGLTRSTSTGNPTQPTTPRAETGQT
jgi:5-phospho-D-xylono-1,4-lactonase